MSTTDLLVSKSVVNSPFRAIQSLANTIVEIRGSEVSVETLSNAGSDMGLVTAGELRVGNDVEPDEGFTGIRISFPTMTYDGQEWHLVGVNNDVLQVGINASDGKLYFGAGAVVGDSTGLTLYNQLDGTNWLKFSDLVTTAYGSIYLDTISRLTIFLSSSPGGTNGVVNGDFELGALTNWTAAGAGTWAAVSTAADVYQQSYSAKLTISGTGNHTLTSDRIAVTAGVKYYRSAIVKFSTASNWTTATLSTKWYDAPAGGSLIESSTGNIDTLTGWNLTGFFHTAPVGAQSVELIFTFAASTGTPTVGIDRVFNLACSSGNQIAMSADDIRPLSPLRFQELAAPTRLPLSGYQQIYSSSVDHLLHSYDGNGHDKQYQASITCVNGSGATANVGDVGYLDAGGDYVTTTTAGLNQKMAVVVQAGANGAAIEIIQAGRAILNYTGSAPADGDYVVFSGTGGLVQAQAYASPSIGGICKAAGSGGVVDVLLLPNRKRVSVFDANSIYSGANVSTSNFVSTISGAPSATSVTYGAVSAGAEDVIVPGTASLLGRLILWNTTRGTGRVITAVNTGTNVITTVSTVDAWANTDAITIQSQTVTSGLTQKYMDVYLGTWQSTIPQNAIGILVNVYVRDTAASKATYSHPYETYGAAKQSLAYTEVANVYNGAFQWFVPLTNMRFTIAWLANSTGTLINEYDIEQYEIATP